MLPHAVLNWATPAGFAVYRYACDVLASTDLLEHELHAIASGEPEQIVVGAGPAYAHRLDIAPDLLQQASLEHLPLRPPSVLGRCVLRR